MMVHILQINDKKSMQIQTLVKKLEQMNLSYNKLGGKWFLKCTNADQAENHRFPRPRINHMATDETAITQLQPTFSGSDKKAKSILNKTKPCRVKKNQIGSLEWDNSVVVKNSNNDKTLVLISLPSYTRNVHTGSNLETRKHLDVAFKSGHRNRVNFIPYSPNHVPIAGKAHSRCCTIL